MCLVEMNFSYYLNLVLTKKLGFNISIYSKVLIQMCVKIFIYIYLLSKKKLIRLHFEK